MEDSNQPKPQKENGKEEQEKKGINLDQIQKCKTKENLNPNQIIDSQNPQKKDKNEEHRITRKNNYEEEKNNDDEEEKKNEEEDKQEKLLRQKRNHEINARKARIKQIEKQYNDFLNTFVNYWKTDRKAYDSFLDNNYYQSSLVLILSQPCIICNQEVIVIIFKFLCNYMYFLKDKLKEIPPKQMLILGRIFFNNCNLFSKYPKIKNNYNYDIFDDNNDLISDNLFYYLFKEMLPEEEIENCELGYNFNCMMKYFLEYLLKIGFLDAYLEDFLPRKDLLCRDYVKYCYWVFHVLNYCNDDFLLKNNYSIRIIRNFTEKINLFYSNAEIIVKEKKEDLFELLNYMYNQYFIIIFGALNRVLDNFIKDNMEKEIYNFLFSIFSFLEFLLKQQKLDLRIISMDKLKNFCFLYKNFDVRLKKFFIDAEKIYSYTKKVFLCFLNKLNIFDLIFGENIHEALIERSYDILSFLYKNNSFSLEQISSLWKISQSKYQSINNSLIILIGKILPEFSKEDCNTILKTISSLNLNEVNEVTLKLLENFFLSEHRHENLLNILFKYSNELSFYEGLSNNIIQKSRSILIKLLFNKNYAIDLIQFIKNSLFCFDNHYLLTTNREIFSEIMKKLIETDRSSNFIELFKPVNENICNFSNLITYLDDKFSLFIILEKNLLFIKRSLIFFAEESIKLKQLSYDEKYDLNSEINVDKILSRYKKYIKDKDNIVEENMIEDDDINNNNDKNDIVINYLLPRNEKDIDNYYKTIIIDFIDFLKSKILKKDIKLTDSEIQNIVFSDLKFSCQKITYNSILSNILINMIYPFHEYSFNYIKRDLLDFLFNILVDNCSHVSEKIEFFNLSKILLEHQFKEYFFKIITDEDIEYLCLEKIASEQVINLPYNAYETMHLFLVYTNLNNNNITYSQSTKKFIEIKKMNLLIGFKTILDFYLLNNDINISPNALSILTNIIEVASCDMINRKYLLDELFSLLEKYKIQIKENLHNIKTKIVFRRLLRLISVINKTKVSKNIFDKNDDKNYLDLNINDNFFNNNDENKFLNFKAFKGLTIKEFKNELIDNVICVSNDIILLYNRMYNNNPYHNFSSLEEVKIDIKNTNTIMLYYNDIILKNEFTLADYNIKSGENILVLNSDSVQNEEEFNMTQEQLKDGYEQIKVVFNDKFSEEIMKEALYMYKGDTQNAIIYLTDENNVLNLIQEIENKKKSEPKKIEELICLEEERFKLLLDILNEGDNDLNDSIWELFSEIKFPEAFITNSIENDFGKLNEEKNMNKKLLILKIVNSIIFDDNTFCKHNKINKKNKDKWISKFINNEKFIKILLESLLESKLENNSEINYSKIIDIIINIFKTIFEKISYLNKNKTDSKTSINENEKQNQNNNLINNNESNEKVEEEIYGQFNIEEKGADNFINILSKNNFVNLVYSIFVIALQLSKVEINKTKIKIIKNIYDILIEYLKIIPHDINKFLEEENKGRKILNILTTEKELIIRKSTLQFIKKLIEALKQESNVDSEGNNINDIQSSLLDYYYPNLISDEVYQEEFYELYYYLFNLKTLKPHNIEIKKIIEKFVDNLYDFYIKSQNSDNIGTSDNFNFEQLMVKLKYNIYILCSFSPFYNDLLKVEIEQKLKENKDIISILYNCLFKIKIDNLEIDKINYLFSNTQLRSNSLNLLENLVSLDKKYCDILLSKIIHHHQKISKKKTDLPLDYPLRDKSQKFLGLKNLGATCYLNSLFQQLFMIPTFQQDIFNFNIIDEENNNKNNLLESTIYNIQITYTNLKKSIMYYYPPISFINSFKKAFNGEPIRLGVQQDTDEFLAILCDKLEKEAKKFDKDNFLDNSFKGKITNEIVSLENEYPYYSQSDEPFYRITLDIKGHQNLEDALDAYIKGEILDGDNKYYVEKYKKKISIKKRTSLKKIGNQIIIHLKRFEFDFITFRNNKLNDYLKFPLTINLKKWTRAFLRMNEIDNKDENNISEEEEMNLDEEKMNYVLTGILVHSGANLQSGHYYSFIKDQETDKWYKFNDNSISDYNIDKDLETECFGNINSKINQYGKGAYLLFYTKKECIEKYKKSNHDIKINDKILKEVENENIEFLKIKTFTSETYHKFLINFIEHSLNYLKTEKKDDRNNDNMKIINENKYSILITEKLEQEIEIFAKIMKKESNIIIENNTIKKLPENIIEIYEKYKGEITSNDNKAEKRQNDLNEENIIKLFFYYLFGIVFQYSDKESKLKDSIHLLKLILSENPYYSVIIMKLIEDNISIFNELLFKYGFIDKDMTGINQYLHDMYKTLFYSLYNYEKQEYGFITPETYIHFNKNANGHLIVENSYKSLFLRLFKKTFCDNLEKCRKEYSRESLFLNLFLLIILSFPESCIVSSNYLVPLISFITNNNLKDYKSTTNPNYKMGKVNPLYTTIFSEIITRCATPWMQTSKKETPYILINFPQNLKNTDLFLYPKLPKDWEKMLTEQFFLYYILANNNINCITILLHLCYEDKSTSIKILKLVNKYLKKNNLQYPQIEIITGNAFKIFELQDSFVDLRIETLFELENNGNENEETLNEFYINNKYRNCSIVTEELYIISKAIENYNCIFEYFKKNKDKLKWVNDYYMEFFMDIPDKPDFSQQIRTISQIHPDVFEVIEGQFINKLKI